MSTLIPEIDPRVALDADTELGVGAEPDARSQWQLFRRRFMRHRLAVFGLIMLLLLYIGCFTASLWVPQSPTDQDILLAISKTALRVSGLDRG